MAHELMSLIDIDACLEQMRTGIPTLIPTFGECYRLVDTARAAHELKAENEKLRSELEAANRAIARHEKLHRQGPRDAVDLG